MSGLVKIPCVMMRGGTSRGPYFHAGDLPADIAERDRILLSVMGSGHQLQIDGIGGGNPVTSKVAIVSKSKHPEADVDYLFAQVNIRDQIVDTAPNCGNMLVGIAPFAIEQGLVPAKDGHTTVRIYNVNTDSLIHSTVETPDKEVNYEGSTQIDGVPGTAAPVTVAFLDATGAKTGKLFPTGNSIDTIDGVDMSLVDCAMPMMMMRAEDMGKTGYETVQELEADKAFMARMEALRLKAGLAMGFGDVKDSVIPKPVLLAKPQTRDAVICVRYFMPHECHPSLAVTGTIGIGTACATPGNLASNIAGPMELPKTVLIENPAGVIEVFLSNIEGQQYPMASLIRTSRKLFEGYVYARAAAGKAA